MVLYQPDITAILKVYDIPKEGWDISPCGRFMAKEAVIGCG